MNNTQLKMEILKSIEFIKGMIVADPGNIARLETLALLRHSLASLTEEE